MGRWAAGYTLWSREKDHSFLHYAGDDTMPYRRGEWSDSQDWLYICGFDMYVYIHMSCSYEVPRKCTIVCVHISNNNDIIMSKSKGYTEYYVMSTPQTQFWSI